jgi:hypothetical protein
MGRLAMLCDRARVLARSDRPEWPPQPSQLALASGRGFPRCDVDSFQLEHPKQYLCWWLPPLDYSIDDTSVNSRFSRPTALSTCVGNLLPKQSNNILAFQDFLHSRQLAVSYRDGRYCQTLGIFTWVWRSRRIVYFPIGLSPGSE